MSQILQPLYKRKSIQSLRWLEQEKVMEGKRAAAMEDVFKLSARRGAVVDDEEKKIDSAGDPEEIIVKIGNKRLHNENNDTSPSSPEQKHLSRAKQELVLAYNAKGSSLGPDSRPSSSSQKEPDDQLESARAEMGEVRQENQRLKMYLDRIMKDYQTLQMQFINIVQQESKKSTDTSNDYEQEMEEPELVSLSLGRFSSDSKKDDKNKNSSQGKEDEDVKEGLSLGLDCKFESSKSDANESLPNPSPGHSSEEQKEEAGETWPPSKVLKTMRSGDDEILQQSQVKKARVSVRARCDTPTMNDGCQWRKYGQKIAKGNPCPRAYYRCTVAPSCPVRKQVQRCAEDMSILITTYEGTHNHPLPVSATAMASTTSAAASMLLSGSSSSSRPGSSAPSSTIAGANSLHGLNFYLSDSTKSKQYYLPNSSFSTAPSHPTITLDLTTNAPSSSSSHFSRFTSNYPPAPRYSSTNLNFSSSESGSLSWGSGLLSYGCTTQPTYIKNQIGTLNLGRQPLENVYQSYMQKNNPTPQQSLPPDTIAAATKAITADPSFQSALAAALKTIIVTGNSGTGGANQVSGDNFGQKLKWGEQFPLDSGHPETVKGSGCASSYLNKSSTTNSQPGSLIFLPPSVPFSTTKSASASPSDNREHTN